MYRVGDINFNYWLKRMLGRATCELGKNTRLYGSARIQNARGSSHSIRIGNHSIIKGELLVFAHGGEIAIGEWCYVGEGTRIWSAQSIKIGSRVLISHNVNIFDNLTHPLSASARHRQFVQISRVGHPTQIELGERAVIVDDDVLIGAGSTILRGVKIGQGAVVGAGSLVNHDVPAWVVVAGNPARIIREIPESER